MGGAFQVDRVLQNTSGAVDELAFQLEQKIKAVANEFHYLVINGKASGTAAPASPTARSTASPSCSPARPTRSAPRSMCPPPTS